MHQRGDGYCSIARHPLPLKLEPIHPAPFIPSSRARLRDNSCARRLRGLCFSGSSRKNPKPTARKNIFAVPSQNAAARLGSSICSLSNAPVEQGRKEMVFQRRPSTNFVREFVSVSEKRTNNPKIAIERPADSRSQLERLRAVLLGTP